MYVSLPADHAHAPPGTLFLPTGNVIGRFYTSHDGAINCDLGDAGVLKHCPEEPRRRAFGASGLVGIGEEE